MFAKEGWAWSFLLNKRALRGSRGSLEGPYALGHGMRKPISQTVFKGSLLRFWMWNQWIFPVTLKTKISPSEQKMQGQLSKQRAAPSIPSVIAQLFALEDEGRQAGSLSNRALAPAGRSWCGPSSSGAREGEGWCPGAHARRRESFL